MWLHPLEFSCCQTLVMAETIPEVPVHWSSFQFLFVCGICSRFSFTLHALTFYNFLLTYSETFICDDLKCTSFVGHLSDRSKQQSFVKRKIMALDLTGVKLYFCCKNVSVFETEWTVTSSKHFGPAWTETDDGPNEDENYNRPITIQDEPTVNNNGLKATLKV